MPASPATPATGEMTGSQSAGASGAHTGRSTWGVYDGRGFDRCPAGTFETYRRMRTDPTIALGRAVANAPITSADWAYEADDGVPDERIDFIRSVVDPLRAALVRDLLSSLDFGFVAAEKVWALDGGRMVLEKIKCLNPDLVKPLVDKATGAFVGIEVGRQKQTLFGLNGLQIDTGTGGNVTLPREKALWHAHDPECGDLYGRSRYENIREFAWWPWQQTIDRTGRYVVKTSGIIPIMQYPLGSATDQAGAEKSTFEVTQTFLGGLSSGKGVALPMQLAPWAEELIRKGVTNIKDLMAWQIEFLEARAGHGDEYLALMRYFDSLKMRGMLVPERVATEGQQGTKAEAGTHGDVALQIAEDLSEEIAGIVNAEIVDHLLVVNFGLEAKGTVRVAPAPLADEDRAFFRSIFEKLFSDSANMDIFTNAVDIDSALDKAGLPKAQETIDLNETMPTVKGLLPEGTDPAADPALPAPAPKGGELNTTQETVLNGAQVSAATAIVEKVAAGIIPRDAGIGQLVLFFNLTPEQAEDAMGSAGMSNVPTTPNPRPNEPEPKPEPEKKPPVGDSPDDEEDDEE